MNQGMKIFLEGRHLEEKYKRMSLDPSKELVLCLIS